MRYWLRCLVAGASPAQNAVNDVRAVESGVFGAAGDDKPTAGAVATTLHTLGQPKIETFAKDRAVRTADGGFMPTGKDYLFWSMAQSSQPGRPNYLPNREYIVPKTQFVVTLRTRSAQDEIEMRRAVASLWLASNLGSIGARASRCAGSFGVVSAQQFNHAPAFNACTTVEELKQYLGQGLRQSLQALGVGTTWHTHPTHDFDALSPTTSTIWIVPNDGKPWATPMEAVNGLGEKLRNFRTHHNASGVGGHDHDEVLDWLEGKTNKPDIQRAVFGLPIPFKYSNGGPQDVLISEESDRRSSPLHMRVTKLSNNTYVGVLVLMKSDFLGPGVDLKLQIQNRRTAPAPRRFNVIQDFVHTFKNRVEVTL
jgi:CRISPR/Cas system CMR-associated protein Cmr1 (group 7 of RAMP superfamily)